MQAKEIRALEPNCSLFLVACKVDRLQLAKPVVEGIPSQVAGGVALPAPQCGSIRRSLDVAGYASREDAEEEEEDSAGEGELAVSRDEFVAYCAGIQAIPISASAKTGEEQ